MSWKLLSIRPCKLTFELEAIWGPQVAIRVLSVRPCKLTFELKAIWRPQELGQVFRVKGTAFLVGCQHLELPHKVTPTLPVRTRHLEESDVNHVVNLLIIESFFIYTFKILTTKRVFYKNLVCRPFKMPSVFVNKIKLKEIIKRILVVCVFVCENIICFTLFTASDWLCNLKVCPYAPFGPQ